MLGTGSYSLKGTDSAGKAVALGVNGSSLTTGGAPTEVTEPTVARVYADTRSNTITVTPITSLNVKGVIVPDGTTLAYAGNGRWEQQVTLDRTTSEQYINRSIYFALNNDEAYAIRRHTNSSEAGVAADGFSGENIRLNNGTYTLWRSTSRRHMIFGIDAEINPYRVSVFGSSVANGQGASELPGLRLALRRTSCKKRAEGGREPVSARDIGRGHRRQHHSSICSNRYDDVIHDFGHFVAHRSLARQRGHPRQLGNPARGLQPDSATTCRPS